MTVQTIHRHIDEVFTHLHENPEVSWQEVETTAYLMSFLKDIGLTPKKFDDITGFYVDIGEGTPTVGFRTDMDALWQEVEGTFQANHSCGHDGHMALTIGVILLLNEQRHKLKDAIRIIFQPAEEKGQGAKELIARDVVEPLHYLFGVHVRPLIEIPEGVHAPALYHGAAKIFTGTITGIEAHAARPAEGINAIEVATALVDAMKRPWFHAHEVATIKMTQLQAGGSSANIIPGGATFSIDARAQMNETMEKLTDNFYAAVAAVSALYKAKIDITCPAEIVAAQVNEDAKNIMEKAIIATVGQANCAEPITTPGGEDFHYYAYYKPTLKTTMLGLGCGVTPGLHHPAMTFNQEHLLTGAKIITNALLLALDELHL